MTQNLNNTTTDTAPAAAAEPAAAASAAPPAGKTTTAAPQPKRRPSRRANTAERRAMHNAVEHARREMLNGRFEVGCFYDIILSLPRMVNNTDTCLPPPSSLRAAPPLQGRDRP
ncbi:hypothetical protein C8J57DRAFT_1252879 [Mycena rebaudengoi]|nr:hypothetical protein C8J57DRAFT_1252879 [Mycena rebaudengoi]